MITWCSSPFSQWIDAGDYPGAERSLGEREMIEFRRFTVPKRCEEWLASRIAIKHLIRSSSPGFSAMDPARIEIIKEPSGVPHIEIDGVRLKGSLSLSHSQGRVFCAWSPAALQMGADIERIEAHAPEFVGDYFTPLEMQTLKRQDESHQPLLSTLIWSAKEAVLKALSLGLSCDTRSVEVLVHEGEDIPALEWSEIGFRTAIASTDSLRLFWRSEDEFVLTLCAPVETAAQFERLFLNH